MLDTPQRGENFDAAILHATQQVRRTPHLDGVRVPEKVQRYTRKS